MRALVLLLFPLTVAAQNRAPRSEREIRAACVANAPENRGCKVSEFAEFGRVGGEAYYYALYCIVPTWHTTSTCGDTTFTGHDARGLAVFVRDSAHGTFRIAFERADPEVGIVRYMKPALALFKSQQLLQLSIAYDGTGNGNASEYFIRENAGWVRIESEEWLKDLQGRLPKDRAILKGVWPDLATLRADVGLYRNDDANCCPTGGGAHVRLAIRAHRFVLDSLTIDAR